MTFIAKQPRETVIEIVPAAFSRNFSYTGFGYGLAAKTQGEEIR